MINQVFDKVFLINLDRRTDRLAKCDDWFMKNGVEYERLSACDGNAMQNGYDRKSSELGCKLSHVKALTIAEAQGYNRILILEDDFDPVDNFMEKFELAWPHVPEWTQLYFGGNHQFRLSKVNDFVSSTRGTATTHAYAIDRSIFHEVLNGAKSSEPIDTVYRVLHLHIKVYAFTPSLINQSAGFSDIINQDVNYDFMR